MGSKFTKEVLTLNTKSGEVVLNNVITGNFTLMRQPIDYQITIHINNMLNTYNKTVIKNIKEKLYHPDMIGNIQIENLINYYGVDAMRSWFTLIYGWDFTQKVG